jgi:death on curing protein
VSAREWRWITDAAVLAIHDEQIAEHGGLAGVRDQSLLLSALARPRNLVAYGEPDLAELAAAYAVGIARNHAFLDGNKRTAWVVAESFSLKNGYELTAGDHDGVMTMLAAAEGSISEQDFAAWFRTWMRPRASET